MRLKRLFLLTAFMSVLFPAQAAPPSVRLATTTSTENSGLLKYLLPRFTEATGYPVHVLATGTGKALRMGQDGDVDLVLVHAPEAEQAFMDAGHGVERAAVMYNDFVLVGPAADPAGIAGAKDAQQALERIRVSGSLFVSRGDDSGTHKKELELWQAAGLTHDWPGYREAGQGMGKVLQMAAELDAYTLADRGTWLAMRKGLPLKVLSEGDARLLNPYSVILVNPEKYPDINLAGAKALHDWLISGPGQALIGSFKVDGEVLFHPIAR